MPIFNEVYARLSLEKRTQEKNRQQQNMICFINGVYKKYIDFFSTQKLKKKIFESIVEFKLVKVKIVNNDN